MFAVGKIEVKAYKVMRFVRLVNIFFIVRPSKKPHAKKKMFASRAWLKALSSSCLSAKKHDALKCQIAKLND